MIERERYTIDEAKSGRVTVTDPVTGIAIQFTKGDTLQRYVHEVHAPARYLESESGLDYLGITAAELVKFAAEKYPREFETLNC